MTALHYKCDDGGPEVVVGHCAVHFIGEKCRLHLHQLLQEHVVQLGDVSHKVHGGHQGNVVCVEADDSETLDDVAQLLHVLLVDISLLGAILPNEEELAESRQEFLRQSLQLRSGLSPARQSGGDQQLPGGDDLRQTLVQSPPLEIRSRQPSRQAFQGALDLDYAIK